MLHINSIIKKLYYASLSLSFTKKKKFSKTSSLSLKGHDHTSFIVGKKRITKHIYFQTASCSTWHYVCKTNFNHKVLPSGLSLFDDNVIVSDHNFTCDNTMTNMWHLATLWNATGYDTNIHHYKSYHMKNYSSGDWQFVSSFLTLSRCSVSLTWPWYCPYRWLY